MAETDDIACVHEDMANERPKITLSALNVPFAVLPEKVWCWAHERWEVVVTPPGVTA